MLMTQHCDTHTCTEHADSCSLRHANLAKVFEPMQSVIEAWAHLTVTLTSAKCSDEAGVSRLSQQADHSCEQLKRMLRSSEFRCKRSFTHTAQTGAAKVCQHT